MLKSPVAAGSLGDANWGSNLTEYDGLARAFVDSLRNVGCFDAMVPSMRRVPMNTAAAIVSVGASSDAVDEGSWKPIATLSIDGGQVTPRKAVAVVVCSNDLLRSVSAEANALIRRELQSAVAHSTDAEFVDALTTGASPIASLGADAVREDLAALLSAVEIGRGSKLYLLAKSAVVKAMAMTLDPADSRPAFPNLRVDGGDVAGITVMPCDAVEDGEVVLVDASGVACSPGSIVLGVANSATIRMDSDPANAEAATSLFQKNLVGIKAERLFGATLLRDSAVAVLSGADYEPVTA